MKRRLYFILTLCLLTASFGCRAAAIDSVFNIDGSMGRINVHLQLPVTPAGPGALPMVIVCHGLGGNQNDSFISEIAADVLEDGMGVVRFDFNGHGASEGDFTNMDALNIQDDLRRVIAWTFGQPFTRSVSLVGHSLGGIVAGMVAPDTGSGRIESVVLLAAGGVAPDLMLMGNFFGIMFDPWDLPEYITLPNGRKLGRNYLATMRDLPIYQMAAKYTGPVLVLNGIKDRIVPYNYAIRYAEVMPGAELRLIADDDHLFSVTSAETARAIAHWLAMKTSDD